MTRSNVVMVASTKGGVGKSTISIHLGRALQLLGFNVVVVDIDEANRTACRLVKNWEAANPDVPAPLPQVIYMPGDVEAAIESMSQTFDLVVVDAGAGAPRQNQLAIKVADLVLVPVTPHSTDIDPTLEFLAMLKNVSLRLGRPKARVILNRLTPSRASADEAVALFTSPNAPVPAIPTWIFARESFPKMNAMGVTAFDYPRSNDLREKFTQLARSVLDVLGPGVPKPSRMPVAQRNSAGLESNPVEG